MDTVSEIVNFDLICEEDNLQSIYSFYQKCRYLKICILINIVFILIETILYRWYSIFYLFFIIPGYYGTYYYKYYYIIPYSIFLLSVCIHEMYLIYISINSHNYPEYLFIIFTLLSNLLILIYSSFITNILYKLNNNDLLLLQNIP